MTSRRWLVAAAVALVGQLLVLYWPQPHVPGGLAGHDGALHGLVFFSVAYPALRAGLQPLPVLAALAGHAVVSEVLQYSLVPGRHGDALDVLADLVGLLIATVAWYWTRVDGARTGPPSPRT